MRFFNEVFSVHRSISVEEMTFESDKNNIISTMGMKLQDFIITMNSSSED